jgi:hypothetical protein
MTKKKLVKLLKQGTKDCIVKKAFAKAFYPLILVEPTCKADLIMSELAKENDEK